MHGEYKVPGGKLVVFDAELVDDRIEHPRLSGDFFVEPDEALEDMNEALVGVSAHETSEQIAERVREALPRRAELFGITPEAVGVVVRRAIAGARDWRAYDWRVLRTPMFDPRIHVALDQVLTEEVGRGNRGPTVRFWRGWWKSAVIIGSFQSVRNEVDIDNAERYDFDVVRRITGGGAMFMERGNIITYSIYAPQELVSGMTFAESYAFLDAWVLEGLQEIGIEAQYEPLNDIATREGKIGGAAQKRLGSGAVLHHATLSYDIDAERMSEVLRTGREKISDKGIVSAHKRVSPLKDHTGMRRDDIVDHLEATFMRLHGGTLDELREREQARAIELADSKFASRDWTYRIP